MERTAVSALTGAHSRTPGADEEGRVWGCLGGNCSQVRARVCPHRPPPHRTPLGQALLVFSQSPCDLVAGGFLPAQCQGSGAHTKSPDSQLCSQAGGKKAIFGFFHIFNLFLGN